MERPEREDATIRVAVRALTGEPAGFPTLHRMHALVQLEPPFILEGPCVRETMRGGGIATALPADARAFTQAVDAAGIILSAQRDNARAQRVYERTGYVRDDQSFHYAPTVGWAHQTGE